jgi:MFS transporter, ACS family, tartrate transporter
VDALEARTIRKVSARLVPFLIVCYFASYLDRINLSFAALTMNRALGLSASEYGFAAGIFFLGYIAFEVPSNLMLARVGARRWIARIMFSWGLVSGAMTFVTGPRSLDVLRVLLGIAEAGFFPGIIYLLTLWFPAAYRGRVIGSFMAAIPLSSVIGAPVSGLLLGLDGFLGIRGWQWLFITESAPVLILSVVVLFYLTDRPADATWLEPAERAWLVSRMEQELSERERRYNYSVMQALLNPRVLALGVIYFGAVASVYGLGFFLPLIVQRFGLSNLQTGLVTSLPYAAGVVGVVLWGRRSDRKLERRLHTAFALFLGAAGLAGSTALDDPVLKMAALSLAGFGIFGSLPVFWTLPTAFLSGTAGAGSIALINSIGNLSGFAGPYAMGWLADRTGGYAAGLLALAAAGFVAMLMVLGPARDPPLHGRERPHV